MRYLFGDMFVDFPDNTVWLVTTNAWIKQNGELTMGRGAALQAAQTWPELPKLAGEKITHLTKYGTVIVYRGEGNRAVGLFQVKMHWKNKAELGLIRNSILQLIKMARKNPSITFRLNYPGIGAGGLRESEVEPNIAVLPDNVEIWRFQ